MRKYHPVFCRESPNYAGQAKARTIAPSHPIRRRRLQARSPGVASCSDTPTSTDAHRPSSSANDNGSDLGRLPVRSFSPPAASPGQTTTAHDRSPPSSDEHDAEEGNDGSTCAGGLGEDTFDAGDLGEDPIDHENSFHFDGITPHAVIAVAPAMSANTPTRHPVETYDQGPANSSGMAVPARDPRPSRDAASPLSDSERRGSSAGPSVPPPLSVQPTPPASFVFAASTPRAHPSASQATCRSSITSHLSPSETSRFTSPTMPGRSSESVSSPPLPRGPGRANGRNDMRSATAISDEIGCLSSAKWQDVEVRDVCVGQWTCASADRRPQLFTRSDLAWRQSPYRQSLLQGQQAGDVPPVYFDVNNILRVRHVSQCLDANDLPRPYNPLSLSHGHRAIVVAFAFAFNQLTKRSPDSRMVLVPLIEESTSSSSYNLLPHLVSLRRRAARNRSDRIASSVSPRSTLPSACSL